jgi:hypothetical protein
MAVQMMADREMDKDRARAISPAGNQRAKADRRPASETAKWSAMGSSIASATPNSIG